MGASNLLNKILFCLLAKTRRFRPLKQETGTVLLVHFAHIGDFVVWLDSARAYRTLYPGKRLVLLCRRFKDISELAVRTGFFDEVLLVDDGWKSRIASVLHMMGKRYDIVINTRPSRELQSDLFVLAPRSGARIAPSSDKTLLSELWRRRSDAAYTRIIPCDGIRTMELIRNAQFVRGQGDDGFRAGLPMLPAAAKPEGLPKAFFAVCPGANNRANRWPPERFAAAIDTLTAAFQMPCVLVGQEETVGQRVRQASENPERILSWMGKTTQSEYVEVIRAAAFLLTNDTSAGHIAPAVRTPAVVIQPGWNYGRFFPYETERAEDREWFPYAVSAPMPCRGCGKDPTVNGNPACIEQGVMRCVLAIGTRCVCDAVLASVHLPKQNKEQRNVIVDEG